MSGAPRWWLSEDKRERDLREGEIVSPVLRMSGGEMLDHLSSLVHMRIVRMNIPSSSSPSRAGGISKGALSLSHTQGTGTVLQAGVRWPVESALPCLLEILGPDRLVKHIRTGMLLVTGKHIQNCSREFAIAENHG